MAILSEQVYMIVRNELESIDLTAYSDYVPDETAYPFCMYEIIGVASPDPDTGFNQDYEVITVRFNIYDNNVNPIDAIDIAEQIEDLFNRTELEFVDETEGKTLICCYKEDDSVTYLNEDSYWLIIGDYEFQVQRDL